MMSVDFEGKVICGFGGSAFRDWCNSRLAVSRGRHLHPTLFAELDRPADEDAFREVCKNWNEVCGID